jgi:hypothetical protein
MANVPSNAVSGLSGVEKLSAGATGTGTATVGAAD